MRTSQREQKIDTRTHTSVESDCTAILDLSNAWQSIEQKPSMHYLAVLRPINYYTTKKPITREITVFKANEIN